MQRVEFLVTMAKISTTQSKESENGKLRIGDDWNAIRIIALSQSNPLKAIAEFVENCIDARARTITITRGSRARRALSDGKRRWRRRPRDPHGLPDFKYVATHICDSIKRRLKADGSGRGLQGEFGIGLLSFWTVGERLTMTSGGADQRLYQMVMNKGDPRYTVSPRRVLFADPGTELKISPLLDGIRSLSGEKIQWYLASELRDRIRATQVRVTVVDKLARKQYEVEPRQFEGRLRRSERGQFWRGRPAQRLGKRTSGMKPASRWRIDRIGRIARDRRRLRAVIGIGRWHRCQQRPRIGMRRRVPDLVDRTEFDHLAEIHHQHAVGNVAHHVRSWLMKR